MENIDTDSLIQQTKLQIDETRQFLDMLERSQDYTQKYLEEVRRDLASAIAHLKALQQTTVPGVHWHRSETFWEDDQE